MSIMAGERTDAVPHNPLSPPPVQPTEEQGIDSLTKYIHLAQPPYQFLLQGLPYKLNSPQKVTTALVANPVVADMCDIEVLYHGPQPAGECIATVRSVEAALAFVQVHGRKIGVRFITVTPVRQRRCAQRPPASSARDLLSTARDVTENSPADRQRLQAANGPVSRGSPAPSQGGSSPGGQSAQVSVVLPGTEYKPTEDY